MEYIERGKTYSLSYRELRDEYTEMIGLTDNEFMNQLPKAIHLACFICFFKEIPTYNCLGDGGIVHQLAHLLHIGQEDPLIDLKEIRAQFEEDLKLC